MAVLPAEFVRLERRYLVRRALLIARGAIPGWRETPFTCAYLALLGIGAFTLSVIDGHTRLLVLHGSSTDVQHLSTRPFYVLLTSALWVDSIREYIAVAVVLGLAAAALERRIGTRWVLAIFASGHVGATLLTEGAVAIGVHSGALPSSALSRIDVGVSYGLAATIGALIGFLPTKARAVALVGAWIYLGLPLLLDRDMTSWGHVVAAVIGVAWWPMLARLELTQARRTLARGALAENLRLGMMGSWRWASRWVEPRLPASSWLPRRRSMTRTSRAA